MKGEHRTTSDACAPSASYCVLISVSVTATSARMLTNGLTSRLLKGSHRLHMSWKLKTCLVRPINAQCWPMGQHTHPMALAVTMGSMYTVKLLHYSVGPGTLNVLLHGFLNLAISQTE